MTWRFRKSLRLFPGVRLNIGKRGVTSVSAGPLTIGRKDAAVHVGLPGTGLSWRQRIIRWVKR